MLDVEYWMVGRMMRFGEVWKKEVWVVRVKVYYMMVVVVNDWIMVFELVLCRWLKLQTWLMIN